MTTTAWVGSDGSMIPMTVTTFKRQSDPTTHEMCCDFGSRRSWTSGWPLPQRKRPATCLSDSGLTLFDIDVIIAAPARHGYRAALARHLDVPPERIVVADDEKMHTASLAAAMQQALEPVPKGARAMVVAAGAGITAGAALYREPPVSQKVSAS